MKRWLFLYLSLIGWGTSALAIHVKLQQSVSLNASQSHPCQATFHKKDLLIQANVFSSLPPLHLIGHLKAWPQKGQATLVSILWQGLASPNQTHYFKSPLISTFKIKKGVRKLPAGLGLPLQSDLTSFKEGILILAKGEAKEPPVESKGQNPRSLQRRVEDIPIFLLKSLLSSHPLFSPYGKMPKLQEAAFTQADSSFVYPAYATHTSAGVSTPLGAGFSSHMPQGASPFVPKPFSSTSQPFFNTSSPSAAPYAFAGTYPATAAATPPCSSNAPSFARQTPQENQASERPAPTPKHPAAEREPQDREAASKTFSAEGVSGVSFEEDASPPHSPHTQAPKASASEDKNPSAVRPDSDPSGLDEEASSLPPRPSQNREQAKAASAEDASSPSGQPGQEPVDPLGSREREEFKPQEDNPYKVKVTTKGCTPRIDLKQNRVIIQTKSLTLQKGQVIHETACGDSHQWYPLKKDWACSDDLDPQARVAYSRYRRYWEDKKNLRRYVDSVCQRDTVSSHPFNEEKGACTHKVDLGSLQAWAQREMVYYDKGNGRKVVKTCHPTGPALPIGETRHGCKPLHYFEKNLSVIQKRATFREGGQEYEVLPCRPCAETLPHTFVKGGCHSTYIDGHFQGFGKRQIILEGKKILITSNCEPLSPSFINYTSEGCQGQWEQDFEAGRCYQKVRWYYETDGRRKFLTGCIRADLFYPHRLEIGLYEHDDQHQRSKPVYKVFFEKDSKQHYVGLYAEKDETKFIPHVQQPSFSFVSHVACYMSEQPAWPRYEAYSGSKEIWLRPDGSTYMK